MEELKENALSASGATTNLSGKYLTFFLDEEEYGVDVLRVREIISLVSITKVPRMPNFVKGVINLRGLVIPVVDLRLKFGMPAREYDRKTVIMVVELEEMEDNGDRRTTAMGLIIDQISEVLTLDADNIEPAPDFGSKVKTDYIIGVAKHKETIKILLDINAVLSPREMDLLQNFKNKAEGES